MLQLRVTFITLTSVQFRQLTSAGSVLLRGLATEVAARRMVLFSEPTGLLYVQRGTQRTN